LGPGRAGIGKPNPGVAGHGGMAQIPSEFVPLPGWNKWYGSV